MSSADDPMMELFGPMWQAECKQCRSLSDAYDTSEERDAWIERHREKGCDLELRFWTRERLIEEVARLRETERAYNASAGVVERSE